MATAKQNLPAINNAIIPNDQIVAMSALVDRMHRVAAALQRRASASGQLRRAA